MIDLDDLLRSELDRLGAVDPRPDWAFVAARSGLVARRRRARALAAAVVVATAAVLAVTTPLGAALGRTLDGFSTWLTGEPGTPAPAHEQQAFDRANAHSWLAFPRGTKLRQLATVHAGPARVDLLGFRSGSSELCLRVVVTGASRTTSQQCAALADLRLAGSPVRVVVVDQGVGKGTKTAWYGLDRLHAPNLQITAGIADDSVRSVILRDQQGVHRVPATSNAFLYVARQPDVGQRVSRIDAQTTHGVAAVPFSPAPFGFGGLAATRPAPTVAVRRQVRGGRIGWLDRRNPRGQPLSVLPARVRSGLLGFRGGSPARTRILLGRVLAPDPGLQARVVLSLNAHRAGGPPAGLCITVVTRAGAGGGCAPYPGIFDEAPLTTGTFAASGAGETLLVDGAASDAVARIQVVFANGQRRDVALRDNAFLAELPRSELPARLVALGRRGEAIGASEPIEDIGGRMVYQPLRGKAEQLLAASGAHGSHVELFVGPATRGGQCVYVRHFFAKLERGVGESCHGPRWTGPPVQLQLEDDPPLFVDGRVRPDVASVRLEYADGTATILQPTKGYVLAAIPPAHQRPGHEPVRATGLTRGDRPLGRESFPSPKRRP